MIRPSLGASLVLFLALPLAGQNKQVWVLRTPGEMVSYDATTFAPKQTVKVPPDAVKSPQNVSVNGLGQILVASPVSLPIAEEDSDTPHKVWFWNGHTAVTIDQGMTWKSVAEGSNFAISESAPQPYLAADGSHLFWLANQARRLQREEMDLSSATTWQVWRTDLSGANREDLLSLKLPECHCKAGSCEESCPYGLAWVPTDGVGGFFLLTQFVAEKNQPVYKASFRYLESGGKWTASPVSSPLHRVLDAASDGSVVVEAIPDSGCCGWVNQSNDQALLRNHDKAAPIFDEQQEFKNPDYDVSFYTSNARLSPQLGFVAMTIVATAQANKPIQLAEQGQASPEESQHIRKALAELPAVEIKTAGDAPQRVVYLPHASLVGWISEKEVLMVEDHLLVAYNIATQGRRKSSIRVEDAAHVFLR